jgi:hypothetical protein
MPSVSFWRSCFIVDIVNYLVDLVNYRDEIFSAG